MTAVDTSRKIWSKLEHLPRLGTFFLWNTTTL